MFVSPLQSLMNDFSTVTTMPVRPAKTAADAVSILDDTLTLLNAKLQRGPYCAVAGKDFHQMLKISLELMKTAKRLAYDHYKEHENPDSTN